MQLYLFNNKPFCILIVRVTDEEEYSYIQDNFDSIHEILYTDNMITDTDILVFSLIKEYNKKIENFIQSDVDFDNNIIIDVLEHTNCNVMYECYTDIIKKKECNLNMGFLIEKYL